MQHENTKWCYYDKQWLKIYFLSTNNDNDNINNADDDNDDNDNDNDSNNTTIISNILCTEGWS